MKHSYTYYCPFSPASKHMVIWKVIAGGMNWDHCEVLSAFCQDSPDTHDDLFADDH